MAPRQMPLIYNNAIDTEAAHTTGNNNSVAYTRYGLFLACTKSLAFVSSWTPTTSTLGTWAVLRFLC